VILKKRGTKHSERIPESTNVSLESTAKTSLPFFFFCRKIKTLLSDWCYSSALQLDYRTI
jgi:hypothetical protein